MPNLTSSPLIILLLFAYFRDFGVGYFGLGVNGVSLHGYRAYTSPVANGFDIAIRVDCRR